ncbi:hypothetical protein ABTH88_19210, partial [Acinetobacter baumannii]
MQPRPQPAVRRLAAAALFVCTAAATTPHQAAPDATLFDAARAAQPKLIESLKEMVSIESGSRNAAGLAQMAAYAEKR